jgi:hypothetical protein
MTRHPGQSHNAGTRTPPPEPDLKAEEVLKAEEAADGDALPAPMSPAAPVIPKG